MRVEFAKEQQRPAHICDSRTLFLGARIQVHTEIGDVTLKATGIHTITFARLACQLELSANYHSAWPEFQQYCHSCKVLPRTAQL